MKRAYHPFFSTFAHFYKLVGRSEIPGTNHPSARQALIEIEPAAIKQLDNLSRIHPGHSRGLRMRQDPARMWGCSRS